jgi:hypothetical protein
MRPSSALTSAISLLISLTISICTQASSEQLAAAVPKNDVASSGSTKLLPNAYLHGRSNTHYELTTARSRPALVGPHEIA